MRKSNSKSILALQISIACLAAQTSSTAWSNTIGNDFQRLNPITSGIDYISVEPSQTLEQGKLNGGMLLDFSTNTLPVIEENSNEQSIGSIEDTLLSSHFYAGYGLLPDLEVGLNLPLILTQSAGNEEDFRGEILSAGASYMGVSSKYRLWSNSQYGVALGGNLGTDLMESNPYIGDTNPVYFSFYAAGDAVFGKVKMAANLGYKYRSTGDAIFNEELQTTPIDPVSSELLFSLGANYSLTQRKALVGEIYGSSSLDAGTDLSDRGATAVELLAAYKEQLYRGFSYSAGIGTDIAHGAGTADLRIFAGISYQMDVTKASSGTKMPSSRQDDEVYGLPDEPDYSFEAPEEQEEMEATPQEESPEQVEPENYNIEETELPSFDDPYDYSLD